MFMIAVAFVLGFKHSRPNWREKGGYPGGLAVTTLRGVRLVC